MEPNSYLNRPFFSIEISNFSFRRFIRVYFPTVVCVTQLAGACNVTLYASVSVCESELKACSSACGRIKSEMMEENTNQRKNRSDNLILLLIA